MKSMNVKRILIVVSLIALVGVGTTAYAGWGRGSYGHGPGMQGRGWGHYGQANWSSDLSEEDLKKLEEANQAFFKDTEELRVKIYEKELALKIEMIKETPDPKIAADLQKEISDLEGQFDQKRLERRLEMKKINPEAGRGFMGPGRMGMGRGHKGMGGGRGYMGGGYGPNNCPWR